MNSPWGLLSEIATQYGWTLDYILDGISWANIQLMMADSIKSVKKKDDDHDYDNLPQATDDDIKNWANGK